MLALTNFLAYKKGRMLLKIMNYFNLLIPRKIYIIFFNYLVYTANSLKERCVCVCVCENYYLRIDRKNLFPLLLQIPGYMLKDKTMWTKWLGYIYSVL